MAASSLVRRVVGLGGCFAICDYRHKAGMESDKQTVQWTFAATVSPLGEACAACFEERAGVFVSCGALLYAKILVSLKTKNGISLTPLSCDLNAFTFALNDSADAFVERLTR